MRGILVVVVAAALLSAAPGRAQPFDDDDTGCVPDSPEHRKCSEKLARAFAVLIAGVAACHDKQARAAFAGSSYDEEACEDRARLRLEVKRIAVATLCSVTQLALATDEENALLDSSNPASLDAQNADTFCDSTSATPIDPSGDDPGWVPATPDALWCARGVGKNLAKLFGAVMRCHVMMAYSAYAGRAFDEEACEENNPLTGHGARDRFSAGAAKLLARGGCPPCLDSPHQEALALRAVNELDADNGRLYPCP